MHTELVFFFNIKKLNENSKIHTTMCTKTTTTKRQNNSELYIQAATQLNHKKSTTEQIVV